MNKIEKILQTVGIEVNGKNPWDPQVNEQKTTKEKLIKRILNGGSLAFGESYMDGEWDCEQIDELIFKFFRADIDKKIFMDGKLIFDIIKNKIFNLQNISRAFEVGKKHYDLGNDLYDMMLDKTTKSYTCGYWKDLDYDADNLTKNLDSAQIAKLDLICRKLNLQPGQRVLDIGCGWGNFMRHAAKNYGVTCVGLTVSKEQATQGEILTGDLPIEFVLTDYREFLRTHNATEKFDAIVSIGMFEHVGPKNYRKYMEIAHQNLKKDGMFLLHTIGMDETVPRNDPWFDKYIFPNGYLPSPSLVGKSWEKLFVLEDWHNFGYYYSLTLRAWFENFDRGFKELQKNNPKYDERFYRMWKFYLKSMEGNFRARNMNLWQIVLSKKGALGGYKSVR